MKRFGIALLPLMLLGQGCLADPPQPYRPILFDFKNAEGTPTNDGSGLLPLTTGTRPVAPPLKAGEIGSKSRNVVVSSIAKNQVLPNPFVILGRATTADGEIHWRVRDTKGTEFASGVTVTDALDAGAFGAFRARAFYAKTPESSAGQLEVFTLSPKDGSEQDLVQIPIRLQRETSVVKVFFVDEKRDPNLEHCDQVYPFNRRIPKTTNVAEASVLELLKGPSSAEQFDGARTSLVPGTELRSVEIVGDTATVDFSRQFALGIAGSCRVMALRAQIEAILKQFPGVRNVKILVEGADAESVLQP